MHYQNGCFPHDIRLRLLKVAAMVTVSVRRVHIRLAGAFPLKEAFRLARQQLAT